MRGAEPLAHEGFEMTPFEVEHRMPALGWAFVEPERPGRFDERLARELGVTDVRDFGRLQRGESIAADGGEVTPDQVLGEARPGRKIVITGDTAPCEMTRVAAHAAQLLVHDGTFSDEEEARAAETGHSTVRQAAELAARRRGRDARPGPHLLPLPRRHRARGGPRRLPRRPRRPRLRPGRDPVPRAGRAEADREGSPGPAGARSGDPALLLLTASSCRTSSWPRFRPSCPSSRASCISGPAASAAA